MSLLTARRADDGVALIAMVVASLALVSMVDPGGAAAEPNRLGASRNDHAPSTARRTHPTD